MIRLENITSETRQRHFILFEEQEITFELYFLPQVESWFFNVEFNGKRRNGVRCALGTLHITGANYPFDFALTDLSGLGIDPFKADDFEGGRCQIYMLEADDMADYRGQEVQF